MQKDFLKLYSWFAKNHDIAVVHKLILRGVRLGNYPESYRTFLQEMRKQKINSKKRSLTDVKIQTIRNRFRGSTKLKNQILRRDNYACVWCGSTDEVEIDHIRPLRYFPSLAFEPSNLRVLCQKHNRTRKKKDL